MISPRSVNVLLLFALFVVAETFSSCNPNKAEAKIVAGTPKRIDDADGSCPYVSKNVQGNIVLSWIKQTGDSAIFCYAVSNDNGKTFGLPVTIPSSSNIHPHGENIPKVIFKPSGEIIAVWGAANPNPANAYSGLVFYAQSFDNGKSWTTAKHLVTDSKGYDQRYFDVALMHNGEAGIIWLDNRKETMHEGSALYFASTSGVNGFQQERRLAEPCCECCRTVLLADNNNLHILYRAILNDSIRDMVHLVSSDGGGSFTSTGKIYNDNWVIKGCPHSGPAMTANNKGVHYAWFTGSNPSGIYYTSSNDEGRTRDSVTLHGRHPQITRIGEDGIVIVWDERIKQRENFISSIGLQVTRGNESKPLRDLITPPGVTATNPAVVSISPNAILVAYDVVEGKESYVAWQTVYIRSNEEE